MELAFFGATTSVVALFVFLEAFDTLCVRYLGRIVIPKELRKKYGLLEGTGIEFIDGGDGVTVKASAHICIVCKRPVPEDISLPVFRDCIMRGYEEYGKS